MRSKHGRKLENKSVINAIVWVVIPFDQVPKMRNGQVLMMTELLHEAMDKEKSENFQN